MKKILFNLLWASLLWVRLPLLADEPEGGTVDTDPDNTKPFDVKVGGPCPGSTPSPGMASYAFHAAAVSLNIVDTPLFYNPPRGPNVAFTVTYNQRDANQPTPTPTASSTPTSNFRSKVDV